jgi:hypothetical protein
MSSERIQELRRMANEARQLADLLGYAGAMEHLHQHALRLEAIADELERDLSDE